MRGKLREWDELGMRVGKCVYTELSEKVSEEMTAELSKKELLRQNPRKGVLSREPWWRCWKALGESEGQKGRRGPGVRGVGPGVRGGQQPRHAAFCGPW